MHTLTFDDKERTLAIEILEACLASLPHEIHQTDNHAYRKMLEEKAVLRLRDFRNLKAYIPHICSVISLNKVWLSISAEGPGSP